jgi:N-acetylglutamate synthase-like GNAT family acetyltransferase
MSIAVEDFKPAHHSRVVELITSIQQIEFGLPIRYEDQPDLAEIETFYTVFLVALCNGLPVGTIAYKNIDDVAVIRKMFVQKNFRGSVYQTAQILLDRLEARIRQDGLQKIYLGTTEFFKAAHRFYEKNNYIEIAKDSLPEEFPIMTVDTKFYFKNLD